MKHNLQLIKDSITISQVVDVLELPQKVRGKRIYFQCPLHERILGRKDTTLGNCMISNESDTRFYCYACGEGGDIFALVQEALGMNFVASIDWLSKTFGVDVNDANYVPFPLSSTELKLIGAPTELRDVFFENKEEFRRQVEALVGRQLQKLAGMKAYIQRGTKQSETTFALLATPAGVLSESMLSALKTELKEQETMLLSISKKI